MKLLLPDSVYSTLLDDEDYERLKHVRWYRSVLGYAMGRMDGKVTYLHRAVLQAPSDALVDHINHDKLDNRKCNIRLCTDHESHGNMKPQRRSKSGYKGVFPVSKSTSWRAQLNAYGETKYLGCFETKEEEAKAYNKAAKEHFGEFAWLNPV